MITIYNRYSKKIEIEKVLGEKWIHYAYESFLGKLLTKLILRKRFLSQVIGDRENHPSSIKKIAPFIRDFSIPMEDFVEKKYENFNDFFIRQYKDGKRTFSPSPHDFSAFAEGRYFVFNSIKEEIEFPLKGFNISLKELINHPDLKIDLTPYIGGTLFLGRLCPVDYHRYHFPDDGEMGPSTRIHGYYDSVNPIALKAEPQILFKNERIVTPLQTKNFGKLLYIEVGALLVGKMIQSHQTSSFKKGDEKGYFLFGGSTVIVIAEKNALTPSTDLIENTSKGIETYIRLGDTIGIKKTGAL